MCPVQDANGDANGSRSGLQSQASAPETSLTDLVQAINRQAEAIEGLVVQTATLIELLVGQQPEEAEEPARYLNGQPRQ